jgi:hypothetical protein
MSNVCSYCDSELSSRVEEKLKTCINCFYKISHELNEEKVKRQDVENKLTTALLDLEKFKIKFDCLSEIMLDNRAGEIASENGLPDSQNPFDSNSTRFVSWMCGWASNEAIRTARQALSVVKWTVDSLNVVRQIVDADDDGFGGEVSAKLETIVSKLENIK